MQQTRCRVFLVVLGLGLSSCSNTTHGERSPAVAPDTTRVQTSPEQLSAPSKATLELLEAVEAGNLSQVVSLVDAGANVNATDEHGFQILVNAMAHYNVEIIDYLVQRGAQTGLSSPDRGRDSAPLFGQGLGKNELLLAAAESGDINSVERLLKSGANINAKDEAGFTVLVTAIAGNHTELVKFLVSRGATIVTNAQ